jgi:hypothetical protein
MPSEGEALGDALLRLEDESWRLYLEELRRLDLPPGHPEAPEPQVDWSSPLGQFRRDDPGHPLGPGMPTGGPLGGDDARGSHGARWAALLRRDPCAYCGRRPGGTLDHVTPRSDAAFGEAHNWLNYTGACLSCNGAKRDEPLLLFMLAKASGGRPGAARRRALRAARRARLAERAA